MRSIHESPHSYSVYWTQTVRDASVKAADADKKRQQLTKSEDDVALQSAQLKKENDELKARRLQMTAQAKHLSAKVAALEKSEASAQLRLREALAEVESARTSNRERQFRIQQLQEELVFQEKRKSVTPLATSSLVTTTTAVAAAGALVLPETPLPTGSDDAAIPSWMKD